MADASSAPEQILRDREHVLSAIQRAQQDWEQVLSIVREAEDEEEAQDALMVGLGIDAVQARVVMDVQFRRVGIRQRQRTLVELAEVRRQLGMSS